MVFEQRATISANHLDLVGTDVEEAEEFVYLGSVFNKTNNCEQDIRRHINLTNQDFEGFKQYGMLEA